MMSAQPPRRRRRAIAVAVALSLLCAVVLGRGALRAAWRRYVLPAAGLERGECTWYAYLRAQDIGWRMRFTVWEGRHARTWPSVVANARLSDGPARNAIMVLDGWPSNPYGHVAFVEEVRSRDEWAITHANWSLGARNAEREGVPIYRVICYRVGRLVRIGEQGPRVPLIGFLRPAE